MRKPFILPLIAIFVFISSFVFEVSAESEKEFFLTDNSAYSKVMNTKYVRNLTMKYPNMFIRLEGAASEYRLFYLGFNEGNHSTRYDSLKVDMQGIVYRNADRTLAEEAWVIIK